MREAKTAREALDANNDAMAAVIAAMKAAGIDERDLQTAGIQIQPRYNYTNKPDGSQDGGTGRLPGDQHAVGAHPRRRQDRRDPRQGGVARRQPGRRHHLLQRRSGHGDHRGAQAGGRRCHRQGQGAAPRRPASASAACSRSPTSPIAPMPMPMEAKSFDRAMGAVPVQAGENAYRVQVNVTFEMKN